MSGYKRATVTISEEEYRRLHEADMKRRFRERAPGKAMDHNLTANLTGALQEMERRQRQLEEVLSRFSDDLNSMGGEVIDEILAENALCYERLAAMIEETASDASASLADLSHRFVEAMDSEREQHHRRLQAVMRRLNTFEQREQARLTAARQWLRQSTALADFIQEQFDHERFLPGRLSGILGGLDLAQANLAQGFYESSIQTSQHAFLQLSELRLELEKCVADWKMEYAGAQNALTQFIAEMDANSKVSALGLEGEELTAQVDLAYWSNGKYGELLGGCRNLLRVLSEEARHISVEELRRLRGELLPALARKFEAVIYEARLNALNSQLRMNVAERALEALECHGFRLSEAGYRNSDMRAAFTATLENVDGSRVTIQVLPAEQTTRELTNELVVITEHPRLRTEQEARLQWQELCRSLSDYNLSVGPAEVRAAPPPPVPDDGLDAPFFVQQSASLKRQHDVR